MRIEEIKPSQRKKGRVLVVLSDGEILRLTEERAASLSVGMELDEGELEALRRAASAARVKSDAVRMIGRRALSRKELERKLTQKGGGREEIQSAADWLEDIGALDDENYAGIIARHYGQRGYGPGRVRQELQRRGVPKEYWDAALEELPPSADMMEAYIRQKCRGDLTDPGEIRRLRDGLLRRGFSWSEVREGLARFVVLEEDEF